MQNNQKTPSARRIDLSKCKLLATYGNNPTKVGEVNKFGLINKIGILGKPEI